MRLRRVGSSGSTTTGDVGQAGLLVEDHVGHEAGGAREPPHLLHAGVRRLRRLLRDLDAVLPRAARLPHRAELVDAAERRLVAAGDEPRADAPGVDARALLLEARDQVLVEVVARDDLRRLRGRPRRGSSAPRCSGRRGRRSRGGCRSARARARAGAGPPRPRAGRRRACRRCPRGRRSCWAAPAPRPRRPRAPMSKAMTQLWACVPAHRQAEEAPGEHVRGRRDAAHVGRARGAEAAVGALRPPQAEVDHLVAPRGEADPRGLGRDQRLEVDEVEERRLDELRVEDRPPHADEGLVGEHDRALGHRVDVAAQAQLAELAQEGGVEERPAVVARGGRPGRRRPRP